MKIMRKLSLSLILVTVLIACSDKKNKKEALNTIKEEVIDYQIELGKVAPESVFANDSLSIWGGSLVKGEDDKYHMFYSVWPKKLGWEWVNYSIISHAVSDSPFGPFEHKKDVLPDRGPEFWDGSTTHNPTVHKFSDKYYLYYMGNFGDKKIVSTPGKAKINWEHRNNQRIGVAVADNPNGPWKRFDKPVLDITENDSIAHDALMTSNPSVCQMADGKILMVYKAVGKKFKLPAGGPVVHMVAISESPTGPFKKYPEPIFTFEGEAFPAEDPYIWYQDGKYRAIVKRMNHEGKTRVFSLVYYDSEDGIHWEQGKYFDVSDRTVMFTDGRKIKFDHLERPQVFMEGGEPVALLCAADSIDVNNIRHSFNIQIPLKITKYKN